MATPYPRTLPRILSVRLITHANAFAVLQTAAAGAKQALFGNYRMMKSAELYNFHKSLFSKVVFNASYPASLLEQDWNWQDEFFKTGVIQNYNVAVHGGSEHVGYYVSLDYFGEEGTLRSTGMQKVSGHASLKADITKWLDMNVKVDFTKSSVDYPSSWTMLGDAFFKMPVGLYVRQRKTADGMHPESVVPMPVCQHGKLRERKTFFLNGFIKLHDVVCRMPGIHGNAPVVTFYVAKIRAVPSLFIGKYPDPFAQSFKSHIIPRSCRLVLPSPFYHYALDDIIKGVL
jgi:hypothetical protein